MGEGDRLRLRQMLAGTRLILPSRLHCCRFLFGPSWELVRAVGIKWCCVAPPHPRQAPRGPLLDTERSQGTQGQGEGPDSTREKGKTRKSDRDLASGRGRSKEQWMGAGVEEERQLGTRGPPGNPAAWQTGTRRGESRNHLKQAAH